VTLFLASVALGGCIFILIWTVFSLIFKRDLEETPFGRVCNRIFPSVLIVIAIAEGAAGNMGWKQAAGLLLFASVLPFDRKITK
jgi:hypothetical protein